jgi:hypothetical protein
MNATPTPLLLTWGARRTLALLIAMATEIVHERRTSS